MNEQYTYIFDGNLQAIDNFLVTGGLMGPATRYDVVHINAEQVNGTFRGTDHDPSVARFFIKAPNEAPTDIVIDKAFVLGNAGKGALVGTVTASDADGDALSYRLVNDADGLFTIDAATGQIRTTSAFGPEDQGVRTITVTATDPDGLSTSREISIIVSDGVKAAITGRGGADNLTGSATDQDGSHIDGKNGNDRLQGSQFDDRLVGNGGDDILTGGAGADQFRFFGNQIDGASDFDTITDLNFAEGDTLVFGSFGTGTFFDVGGGQRLCRRHFGDPRLLYRYCRGGGRLRAGYRDPHG
jgi:Ca2+-binding RTX toxin-like protein